MIKLNLMKAVIGEPLRAIKVIGALLRGIYYAVYFRIFRRNVRIKLPFKAFGKVSIVGPGSVIIDRGCAVYKNGFKGLTIVTFGMAAQVEIGKNCVLGGLTVRCCRKITLGPKVISAISLIQDVLLINPRIDSNSVISGELETGSPISLGENVWLGGRAIILKGCSIGADSVIAAGALCYQTSFDNYQLIGGNPAKRGLSIEKLINFKKKWS